MSAYATSTNLTDFGISAETLGSVPAGQADRILAGCSAVADGYLQSSGRITLPLTAWGDDLRMAVCKLGAWELMTVVLGHNPDDPNNFVWKDRAAEARTWLESVARGLITPVGLVDSSPTVEETGTEIYTEPRRGW
jgi:phage gp36-like protein